VTQTTWGRVVGERSTLVFVHSPLVGPSTWAPVASRFAERGVPTCLPDLTGVAAGDEPRWHGAVAVARREIESLDTGETVLVAHSGAGPLLPAIGRGLAVRVRAYVFVDATLPRPGRATPLAPPAFLAMLTDLAVGGVLPPWSRWWPAGTFEALVPDDRTRHRLEIEMPRLPLAYFEDAVPPVAGWDEAPGAYLRLSVPYEDDASDAEARGWPTARLEATHLRIVTDPEDVATRIERLVAEV
jgi:pimeloyl-ACP methyl ester carboxylesterase